MSGGDLLMNYIEINGGRKVERELADRIISWCVFKLLPRHSTLEITLNFEELEKAFGYCLEGDTNSEFELSISKSLPVEDLVATICHEMIHVKQYARRELRCVDGKILWKEKDYSKSKYEDCPWEREAYDMESKLAEDCIVELELCF